MLRVFSDQTGRYSMPLPDGNFDVQGIPNSSLFNITPDPAQISISGSSQNVQQDFCLSATTPVEDLEVIMLPIAEARPGFDADYTIVLNNKGNQPLSGTLDLAFDDTVLDYVSSSITPASQSAGAISWSFTTSQPFSSDQIDVTFNLNSPQDTPPLNSNEILNFTVTGSATANEATPADNTMTLSQTVVNSFDPNDKTCLEGESIDPAMIGEFLHYLIRFENTGTASAINVVIRDEIDPAYFDISTLQPLAGSHDFVTRVEGDVVEFIFEDINLDFNDATNDGHVLFKIKSVNTLQENDSVDNLAEIYFDFNFPIVTDSYVSTFETLSIASAESDDSIVLSPVPAGETIQLSGENNIQRVTIYDLSGRMVGMHEFTQGSKDKSLSISELPSGSYLAVVESDAGKASMKFVKR